MAPLLEILVPRGPEWAAPVVAYLVGSISVGLVLGLLVRGVDIRRAGSGNIGATNAMRVLGRPLGLLAFAGDFGKGWIATFWLAPALAADPTRASSLAVLCGAAAVCGHVWPLYIGFRGGKAVATGCGAIVGVDPVVFLTGGAVWLLTLGLTRFVGLSSMLMAIAFPIAAWWRSRSQHYGTEVVLGTLALSALILARHRSNVARMLAGTEPRVGGRSAPTEANEG